MKIGSFIRRTPTTRKRPLLSSRRGRRLLPRTEDKAAQRPHEERSAYVDENERPGMRSPQRAPLNSLFRRNRLRQHLGERGVGRCHINRSRLDRNDGEAPALVVVGQRNDFAELMSEQRLTDRGLV